MTSLSEIALDQVTVRPWAAGKVPKVAALHVDGNPLLCTLGEQFMQSPFGGTTYDKNPNATRLTLELCATGAALDALQKIGAWIVQAVPFPRLECRGRGGEVHILPRVFR